MEQCTGGNLVLAELNRLNEDHLPQEIDYVILHERLHLAVTFLKNSCDVIHGEDIELLLQSFHLYTVITERELNNTSTRPAIIMLETCSESSSRRGTPKLSISEDALLYFCEIGYSWKDIINVECFTVDCI